MLRTRAAASPHSLTVDTPVHGGNMSVRSKPQKGVAGRRRVILASPFLLADLEDVQRQAIAATREVFGLDVGKLAETLDRFMRSSCPEAHRMDLLRTLAQADPQRGNHWRRIWSRILSHYQIELGTLMLLGSIRANPQTCRFVDWLSERHVRIDVICDWSPALMDALGWIVVPERMASDADSPCFKAIGRASLHQGGKAIWIGMVGQGGGDAQRRGHAVIELADPFGVDDFKRVRALMRSRKYLPAQALIDPVISSTEWSRRPSNDRIHIATDALDGQSLSA